MAINSSALNTHAVNDVVETDVIGTGAGEVISVEQVVAIIGLGEEISFEQTVNLRLSSTVSESTISIEQIVEALFTGEVISVEQIVQDAVALQHVTRTGWDLTLVIGGFEIPKEQIHGIVDIDRTESDAALMKVTIIPETGIQDVGLYHGQSVTLDIQTASGNKRIYTGVVDIPEIDLIDEKITLRCTDRRTELLNSQLPGVVDTIGVYSPIIFQPARDTAEEVEQRLSTTPQALDFDATGNYTITPWLPKSTADFTLTDSDVYRDRPVVELTSRGRIINKVNMNLQYRYERFHHSTRSWTWESPIKNEICLLLEDGYSLTSKSMVRSAAEAAGWPVRGEITFDQIHDSGWYRCSGVTVGWSTVQFRGTIESVVDEKGVQLKDSNGKLLAETRITSATDYGDLYCMGASWQGTQQWTQSVTENYTLTLDAPQSQTQFGTIESDLSYALDEEADTRSWEDYTSFRTTQQSLNYSENQDTQRGDFNVAIDVALKQGKNIILESHRDTRVMVDTFIWPDVDLKHTVLVDTDEIQAKGKVFNIKHRINIGTGEAVTTTTLVLSRSQGSTTDSTLSIPTQPTDSVVYPSGVITLDNHFGLDPALAAAAGWHGMVGNKWIVENNNTFKTTFQEQFIVDSPAIPGSLRNAKDLAATSSYDVEIPNDTLVITFDGKS